MKFKNNIYILSILYITKIIQWILFFYYLRWIDKIQKKVCGWYKKICDLLITELSG